MISWQLRFEHSCFQFIYKGSVTLQFAYHKTHVCLVCPWSGDVVLRVVRGAPPLPRFVTLKYSGKPKRRGG